MSSSVILISSKRFSDSRGWFSEVYNREKFSSLGIDEVFVQDNHSLSLHAATVRGLHFQTPPYAQAKLVRCIKGRIYDVAVDLRKGSPTFGKWVGAELSADNGDQLFIPAGFGHGFITLEAATEVAYKVSAVYAPANDGGLLWSDPDINIAWPLANGVMPLLSAKDGELPPLSGFDSPFVYDGVPLSLVEV